MSAWEAASGPSSIQTVKIVESWKLFGHPPTRIRQNSKILENVAREKVSVACKFRLYLIIIIPIVFLYVLL